MFIETVIAWAEANQILATLIFAIVVLLPYFLCWRSKCRSGKDPE